MKLSDTPKVGKHGDGDKVKHVKKKRLQDDKKQSATVRELLKQKRTDLDMSIPPDLKSPEPIDKGHTICFTFILVTTTSVFLFISRGKQRTQKTFIFCNASKH